MTEQEYLHKIIRARSLTNGGMKATEARIQMVLENAYNELDRIMLSKDPMSVTFANLAAKQDAIKRVLDNMSRSVNLNIRLGIQGTSENISDLYETVARQFAEERSFQINTSFRTVPLQVVENCVRRVWSDGLDFSDRIWKMNRIARDGVNELVSSAIARGESAVDLAKELQRFLIDSDIAPGTSWTTGVTKSVTGKGTVHYNALRLARSEINNSYRETLVINNQKNPLTRGVVWNLSRSHPFPDICDVWAQVDAYRMGPGVFPPHGVPLDHPNGLCYLTEMLRHASQWSQPKEEFHLLDLSREEVISPLSGVSEGMKNSAWKMWNNTNQVINAERRRYRAAI